jgi:hypothetical protein
MSHPFPKKKSFLPWNRASNPVFRGTERSKKNWKAWRVSSGTGTHDEFNVFLIAEYDPFKEEYNIETYTGGQLSFSGQAIFLSTFGRINGVRLNLPRRQSP